MNEQEKKEQNKTLFLCLLFAGITYVAAQWLTTQAIADHLEYSPLLPGEIAGHIYQPFAHRTWRDDPQIAAAIPRTLAQYAFLPWIVYLVGGLVIYQFHKSRQRMTSHGTADFAKEKDIKEAGLAIRENGFVVGINPFNEKLMLHNGRCTDAKRQGCLQHDPDRNLLEAQHILFRSQSGTLELYRRMAQEALWAEGHEI